ncbi:MAG: hypothetical protein WAN65_31020 [Candidatus Sulfotelmatobacter sp.]
MRYYTYSTRRDGLLEGCCDPSYHSYREGVELPSPSIPSQTLQGTPRSVRI